MDHEMILGSVLNGNSIDKSGALCKHCYNKVNWKWMSRGILLLSRVMKTEIQIPDVSGKLDNDHRFCAYKSIAVSGFVLWLFKKIKIKKTPMCSSIHL